MKHNLRQHDRDGVVVLCSRSLGNATDLMNPDSGPRALHAKIAIDVTDPCGGSAASKTIRS